MMTEPLITVKNCTLDHLLSGETILIGTGTLMISIPSSPPPYDSSDSPSTIITPSLLLTLISSNSDTPVFDLQITPHTLITELQSSHYLVSMSEEELGFLRITLPPTINSNSKSTEGIPLMERENFEAVLCSLIPSSKIEVEKDLRGKLLLVDEESGRLVGELTSDIITVDDDSEVEKKVTKEGKEIEQEEEEAVLVEIQDSGKISVSRWTPWTPTSNPTSSKIITLGDYVSRGIIAGADLLAQGMEKGSSTFVDKTKGTDKPLVFSASTMRNVNIGNGFTQSTRAISSGFIGVLGSVAGQVGSMVGSTLGIQAKPNGEIPRGIKGVVHNTLISVNAITDSLETGGKVLINAGTNASAGMIGHKYGQDAAIVTRKVGGSVKHVALVYIDARGVTRKALLKSVGKGAIKAKMTDGREVILSNTVAEEESDIDLVARGSTSEGEKLKNKAV